MLDILDEIHQAKMVKNLDHQFILLTEKKGDEYEIFSDLVKCSWKKIGMAKDKMSDLFFKLRPHVNINKK